VPTVIRDCLVDRLVDVWKTVKERFAHITNLLINLANGPESLSRRSVRDVIVISYSPFVMFP